MYDEKRKSSNLAYKARNREETNKKAKLYRLELRKQALDRYGWECAVCGFSEEPALQIDHIHNDGAAERRALGGQNMAGWKFYEHLKSENWPDGYQTLCANHNIIKHRNMAL